jgi:hypothetical protein
MKIKFDAKMQKSNDLIALEQQGMETAKRLAQEIELAELSALFKSKLTSLLFSQILHLHLDNNNCARIPADKRIDLSVDIDTPGLSPIPPLVRPEELTNAQKCSKAAGQKLYNEIRTIMDEKEAAKNEISKPTKSLELLMAVTHPRTSAFGPLPPTFYEHIKPLEGHAEPITYLTVDQIDEYLYDTDMKLQSAPGPNPHVIQPQDLALRNPNSVYNWLRRNKPHVFLQDGEGSEKSNGKPGSLRGAGKRASMPGPSKPDALEIVDGLGYDPTIGGLEPSKGKRKRDDDGGYHPKSGGPKEGKAKKPRAKKGIDESTPVKVPKKKKGRHSDGADNSASNPVTGA